jgi:hypothetical protein
MIRHFHDRNDLTGRPIRVLVGYDRSRSEPIFFLQIELRDTHELLYAYSDDPYDTGELAYYKDKLAEFELVVPLSVWREALEDLVYGTENRCAQHFFDGSKGRVADVDDIPN